MRMITREVQAALDYGFHYLAVTTALTLPDICGAMESPDGRASGAKFKAWAEAWFVGPYDYTDWLTSDDIYRLRCGVVHQGRMGPQGMQVDRVGFLTAGNRHKLRLENCGGTTGSFLALDAATFCREMVAAVEAWYAAKASDPSVVANLPHVLQNHPNGVSPYIVGVPIIA